MNGKDRDKLLDIAKAWLKLADERAKQIGKTEGAAQKPPK
jgi:hypothetical protein